MDKFGFSDQTRKSKTKRVICWQHLCPNSFPNDFLGRARLQDGTALWSHARVGTPPPPLTPDPPHPLGSWSKYPTLPWEMVTKRQLSEKKSCLVFAAASFIFLAIIRWHIYTNDTSFGHRRNHGEFIDRLSQRSLIFWHIFLQSSVWRVSVCPRRDECHHCVHLAGKLRGPIRQKQQSYKNAIHVIMSGRASTHFYGSLITRKRSRLP